MKRLGSRSLQISTGVKENVLFTQEDYHYNYAHSSSDVSKSLQLRRFDVNICLLENISVNKTLFTEQFCIMQQFPHIVSCLFTTCSVV